MSSDTESDYPYQLLGHYESQLSQEEKDRQVTDTYYLSNIIRHLKSWEMVARTGFGFTEAEVMQVAYDYHKEFKECAYKAYLKWKMAKPYVGSVDSWTILQVLHKAEEFEAIDYLMKDIKKKSAEYAL